MNGYSSEASRNLGRFLLFLSSALGVALAATWLGIQEIVSASPNLPTCKTWVTISQITGDTIWKLTDSPYCVSKDLNIPAGLTLTINPGVIVYFSEAASGIRVFGNLLANGTTSQKIIFTSYSDSPSPGNWGQLRVESGGSGSFNNCEIAYAGSAGHYEYGLGILSNAVQVQNCRIHHNYGNGIETNGSNGVSPTIADSEIDHNTRYAIYEQPGVGLVYDRGPTYHNLTLHDNGYDVLLMIAGSLNFDRILDGYSGLNGKPIFISNSSFIIRAGKTLTLTPGTTMQFDNSVRLIDYGTLFSEGTPTLPITFTTDEAIKAPRRLERHKN